MSNSDTVNHPAHYADNMPMIQIECIDFTEKMSFCQGNAFKYIWRAGNKDDLLEDLNKALWYLSRCAAKITPSSVCEKWRYVCDKLMRYDLIDSEYRRLNILSLIANKDFVYAQNAVAEWISELKKNEE